MSDGNYKCSLELTDGRDMKTFEKVIFSQNNKYIVVQCTNKLMVFDVVAGTTSDINREDGEKICRPIFERRLLDSTYDRILGMHLSEDEHVDQIKDRWVILQSSQYGKIHAIRMNDMPVELKNQQNNVRSLGGKFIKSTD